MFKSVARLRDVFKDVVLPNGDNLQDDLPSYEVCSAYSHSSLSCMNEYLATYRGGYLNEQFLPREVEMALE